MIVQMCFFLNVDAIVNLLCTMRLILEEEKKKLLEDLLENNAS